MTTKTILVTGSTGTQGGAVVRQLLARGWDVRALTRNPTQPAAQALRDAGVSVVQGDNEDVPALIAAMQGAYGVFSVQAAPADAEVRQGKNVVDAAKAAGIQHLVYSSVQNADAFAKAGGEARKWAIEQYIAASGLPATILRPPLFMDNFTNPAFQPFYGLPEYKFTTGILPHVPMGMIAVEDIGVFAALVLEDYAAYVGKTIEIAGDVLTPPQVAAALSAAAGRTITYTPLALETLAQLSPEIAGAMAHLNQAGYPTDLSALKAWHPDLMTFATWLAKTGAAQLRATLPVHDPS